MYITNTVEKTKKRKNAVNEIEKVYVEEGVFSKKFYHQLIDFIGFVINRYSGDRSFPDDIVHFTYLRVMERLGAIKPEKPKLMYPVQTEEDALKNQELLEEWAFSGKVCLFDALRSNLGNYIFSIARHAHSNYMYHSSKKFKELEPPATEIPEQGISYDVSENKKAKVLRYINTDAEKLPLSLRRYLLWKQNS